jgi:phosphatidate cytidylyltransferase
MLLKRVLTVAILLPLFMAALFLLPNLYWGILLTGVIVVAAWEWGGLARYAVRGRALFCAVIGASAVLILIREHGGFATPLLYTPLGRAMYALSAAFWIGIAPAWLYYRWQVRDPWLLGLIGWIVLVPCWHAMVWLQVPPTRLLLALGVVWVADTAAYFVGRRFGRRKLAPQLSPGKTWAGVWGAAGAVLVYWIVVWAVTPAGSVRLVSGLVLVLLMTLLSVAGDLFESWMKRVAGVKDSGDLLPGHGGLLDRVDGLTATLPLAALYFAYRLS